MEIFLHHIYEYKKGLRRMVLYTAPASHRERITGKLISLGIEYIIDEISDSKINVFFGNPMCIKVIRAFEGLDLSKLSDEQDFILGTLLGYDILIQCDRYIQRKRKKCAEIKNSRQHHTPEQWSMYLNGRTNCIVESREIMTSKMN